LYNSKGSLRRKRKHNGKSQASIIPMTGMKILDFEPVAPHAPLRLKLLYVKHVTPLKMKQVEELTK
jgi:hypothetical protein